MKYILFGLILGCSSHFSRAPLLEGRTTYAYVDASGNYKYLRESKVQDQLIITRNQLIDKKGGGETLLEKSIAVSRLGSIKSNNKRLRVVRPEASEYTVWMEGKRYFSRMQIKPSSKAMVVTTEEADKKEIYSKEVPFPGAKYFCFFSQLVECLNQNQLFVISKSQEMNQFDFYIIWDGYPFTKDLYTGLSGKLFSPAVLKFDGELGGLFRYIIEVENQVILYQLNNSFHLSKMAWVSQGITVAPPGEEIVEDE